MKGKRLWRYEIGLIWFENCSRIHSFVVGICSMNGSNGEIASLLCWIRLSGGKCASALPFTPSTFTIAEKLFPSILAMSSCPWHNKPLEMRDERIKKTQKR